MINLEVKKRSCEVLIAELSVEIGGETIKKDLDLSGNAGSAGYYAALQTIRVINEVLEEKVCTWGYSRAWRTSCGESIELPDDNFWFRPNFKFCPFCSRKIVRGVVV